MRAQEAALESTFQKIARIMASRYDLRVVVRGTQAYIDFRTNTIFLPSLDSSVVEGVEGVLEGLLDHETAHRLFTDPNLLQREKPTPELHQLWNVIEDARIEKAMAARYYGCGQNLAAANGILFARVRREFPKMGPWRKLTSAMGLCLEMDAKPEQFYGDPEVGALLKLLAPEIEAGYTVTSTAQALDVAKRILDKIAAARQPPPPPPPEAAGGPDAGKPEDGQEEQQEAAPAPGGGDEEPDPADDEPGEDGGTSPESGEDEPGEGDESVSGDREGPEAAPDAGGGAADEGGEDAGDPGGDAGGAGESGEAGEDAGDSVPSPSRLGVEEAAEGAREQAEALAGELASGAPEAPLTLEGLVNGHITRFLDRESPRDPEHYYVFSEEWDEETTFSAQERQGYSALYEKLKGEVQRYIGTMASQLEMALAAQTQARWIPGELRGRRYDKRKLPAWAMGSNDERIYRVKEEGTRLDTAVTMLWDCSGSMGSSNSPHNKSALARIAAIAFHEALKAVQVPHEVLGFNTSGKPSPGLTAAVKAAQDRGENLDVFSRLDERDARFVFTPFGSNDGRAICAITGGAANRDGEAVLWAARRLAARPEARKVLLVGSDGQPQGARFHGTEKRFLKEAVKRVMGAGIEVFGLGIMDHSVKSYYPSWGVVNRADELPRAVMAQLIRHLTVPTTGMRTHDSDGGFVGEGAP